MFHNLSCLVWPWCETPDMQIPDMLHLPALNAFPYSKVTGHELRYAPTISLYALNADCWGVANASSQKHHILCDWLGCLFHCLSIDTCRCLAVSLPNTIRGRAVSTSH